MSLRARVPCATRSTHHATPAPNPIGCATTTSFIVGDDSGTSCKWTTERGGECAENLGPQERCLHAMIHVPRLSQLRTDRKLIWSPTPSFPTPLKGNTKARCIAHVGTCAKPFGTLRIIVTMPRRNPRAEPSEPLRNPSEPTPELVFCSTLLKRNANVHCVARVGTHGNPLGTRRRVATLPQNMQKEQAIHTSCVTTLERHANVHRIAACRNPWEPTQNPSQNPNVTSAQTKAEHCTPLRSPSEPMLEPIVFGRRLSRESHADLVQDCKCTSHCACRNQREHTRNPSRNKMQKPNNSYCCVTTLKRHADVHCNAVRRNP